jgi:hypothetical protein
VPDHNATDQDTQHDSCPDMRIPRQSVLTDKDLESLASLLSKHPCKFPSVDHEQMDKIVRMSNFFEQVENKIIGGISWAFIAFIGGILYLFYNHGMFIKK